MRALRHPARIVPVAFLIAVAIGTALLMLPVARAGQGTGGAPFITALFTAASSVCVTGLGVVDTPNYWSAFGEVLIMALTQLGGFGIVAMATLVGVLVSDRLGLRSRLAIQQEQHTVGLAGIRQLIARIAVIMLVAEVVILIIVAARLWLSYDYPFGRAVWHGAFHAVQAFNNGGFALYSDSLVGFVSDPWICLTLSLAVVAGSIGFPVTLELLRRTRPAGWSVHTRLTVAGTALLLAVGVLVFLAFEWSNPRTLGGLGVSGKLLAAFTQGAMTRSGGFNTIDIGGLNLETLAVSDALMFIGGGSASTAGGIRVTTFLLLAYVIWAEVKGEPDVVIGRRRIAETTQRQALSVALLGIFAVATGLLALLATAPGVRFEQALFETISAFATVGLSTGITQTLPPAAQAVLVVLMFVGRVGTVAVAAALALNTRSRLYRYPEERPIVG